MYVFVVRTLVISLIAHFEYSFLQCACVSAKLLQSCLTLCDSIDYSPAGSSVHGILQARILELPCSPPRDLPTQGSNLYLLHLLHWQAEF